MAINIGEVAEQNRQLREQAQKRENSPDISVSPENKEYSSQVKYEYNSNPLTNSAVLNSNEEENYSFSILENRVESSEKKLSIFLYNTFPYIGSSALGEMANIAEGINLPGIAGAALEETYSGALSKIKYMTPAELARVVGANFYSTLFFRGVSIKKGKVGIVGPASSSDEWTGDPDLFYGRQAEGIRDIARNTARALGIETTRSETDQGAQALEKEKGNSDTSAEIEINPYYTQSRRKTSPVDILGDINMKIIENNFFVSETANFQRDRNGVWQPIDSSNPKEDLNVNRLEFREGRADDLTTEENIAGLIRNFDFNATWSYGDFEEITNERELQYRDFSLDFPDEQADTIRIRRGDDENDMIEGNISQLLKDKGFNRRNEKWQLGAILVIPIVADQFEGSLPRFYIPFEFNPEIEEGSIEARYESESVLSRIGDLHAFTGVNSQTVEIKTKYLAVAHNEDEISADGHGWMSEFTMDKIQAIEMAYRSIALPHFPSENNIDQGYRYVRPPLIKVIIGDAENQSSPYANLLTYQRQSVVEDRLESAKRYAGRIHRNFLVTSVSIEKNTKESPLYLNDDLTVRDTFEFEVSLNLTEVTPNYMDIQPDYKKYFDAYRTTMPRFIADSTEGNE